jgi:hypothetical protein
MLITAQISLLTRTGAVLLVMRLIIAATMTRCQRGSLHSKGRTLAVVCTHVHYSL